MSGQKYSIKLELIIIVSPTSVNYDIYHRNVQIHPYNLQITIQFTSHNH